MVLFYDLSTERLNEEAAVCFLYISITVCCSAMWKARPLCHCHYLCMNSAESSH